MVKHKILPILLLTLTIFIFSACVDFNVTNLADNSVRVRIETPDGGKYVRRLGPVDVISTFSDHGGSFHIATLPDEEYLKLLNTLRDEISGRLFKDKDTLSAADVKTLGDRLREIDEDVDRVARQGASCSGWAPDFSTVSAVVVWSQEKDNWLIGCEVDEAEE